MPIYSRYTWYLFLKNKLCRECYDNKQAYKMLDMIDRLLEHELNLSAEESSFVAFIICSVSSCPALLLQYVPRNFYKAIGLYRASGITLRTTANEDHGLRSWQVRFLVYRNRGMLTRGWRMFWADNMIKEGDICTFNIIKTMLWHVDIMRHS